MEQLSFNSVKTWLLLAGLTSLLLFLGQKYGGTTGAGLILLLAMSANLALYGFADKILIKFYGAKLITSAEQPIFFANLAYLAERAQIPTPRVYLINSACPNIFSTGRNRETAAIVVTDGLLDRLNKDELAGVIAHELVHILHRDPLISCIASSLGSAVSLLAYGLQAIIFFFWGKKPQGRRANWIASLLMSFIAPMMAIVIRLALSQHREYTADAEGATLCGNAQWLANALRKIELAKEHYPMEVAERHPATASLFIVNPLHNRKWAQLFSTHPPIGERIKRLEAM